MKSIIIEGPDCAGKTTLINQMYPDYKRIHNGVYGSSDIAMRAYIRQLNNMNEDTIFDRMHISELIYGSTMRNDQLNRRLFASVELLAAYRETVMIICLPPKDLAIKNWQERKGKEYVKKTQMMMEIFDIYGRAHTMTKIPVIEYDFTDEEFNAANPLTERVNIIRKRFYEEQESLS